MGRCIINWEEFLGECIFLGEVVYVSMVQRFKACTILSWHMSVLYMELIIIVVEKIN